MTSDDAEVTPLLGENNFDNLATISNTEKEVPKTQVTSPSKTSSPVVKPVVAPVPIIFPQPIIYPNPNPPIQISPHMALPPGWDSKFDQNGRVYYINHINRTTTYVHPYAPVQFANQPMQAQPVQTQPKTAQPPLPPGWEMRFESNGRAYYVDHNTKTTTYTPPKFVQ